VPLSLQSRRVGDIIVLTCSGGIADGAASAVLQHGLNKLLPAEPNIVLNLQQVDFIDSSGLGFLVRSLGRARAAGGDLKLCAVPARIEGVLRITRLRGVFESHESEAAAITAFYRRVTTDEPTNRFPSDILCVEASPDVLAYVCELLRQAGYGVMPSDNLPDALVLLKASHPKLVVISAELRGARGTGEADAFSDAIEPMTVIELPADFARRDAGVAGPRLVDQIRGVIGQGQEPGGQATTS
jgi:anti-sigma B factor antagonist